MPRESKAARTQRAARITRALRTQYPGAHCALVHTNPLQLLVATILSAQCTDVRVNIVTKDLFAKYRTAADYAAANAETFQNEIRSTGFFRNKAKNIMAAATRIESEFGGSVPRTMDELLSLPGVARKTANVVLGNAFGINDGVVVDTHVSRLAQRMKLTRQTSPEKIERDLMDLVPRDDWCDFSHLLIFHGRNWCASRKPDCAACPITDDCPSAFTFDHNKGRRS
jgi:endonuclease-3